ncbi:MAG TPA: transglycosylase domain-containing protein [Kofleriaceae bacterium]|nr:transglycosylase domain-containing protein [Kofleriaceae bacterium]
MRIPGLSRRWLIAGAISLGLVLAMTVGVAVVYPRLGAWMIRDKVGAKLAAKLGRDVRMGSIEVVLGHAVIHGVEVRGPLDGDTPLVHLDRVDVDFDGQKSLFGKVVLGAVKIDGVLVTIHRHADGQDNVHDVIDRLRTEKSGDAGSGPAIRPTSITVTHGRLLANDELTGATGLVGDADASWTPERIKAEARNVTATTLNAPRASAAKIDVEKVAGATPIVSIDGGELALWPKLALSGIAGKIVADPKQPSEYIIDLAGGYGGVPGRLWTAKGDLDARALNASLDLEAAKFQLDRLAPILAHSAVVDYDNTSVDTKLHLDIDRAGARFAGNFHLSGLNVGHPLIADQEVHDLDLSGQVAGSFARATRTLELTQGDFVMRNMPFSITGVVSAPHGNGELPQPPAPTEPGDKPPVPRVGPHGLQLVKLRLVIPPIDCQRVLSAIPVEMAPYMAGYRMHGTFDTDVHLDIDWSDLDATQLDGHIGIKNCKVVDEPADSPKRLKEEFTHDVEVEQGEWISFDVGPSNDEFVPLDQISPYLVKSIMSTEDSAFYQHHGFITSEFRTALVNNLKAGKFVQGASSITMQMVKNVLLFREKTLARKLQELFLTWDVENTLSKDRILEIYLNVIEYGPGLYGIGPAAYHFFGKKPKDLNPVEAAFFSTILPSPKERYKQYCAGTLTKWTTGKIDRILQIMLKRDRLTQAEYDTAIATPLLFSKDGSESEEDCMKRVKKAIKNARPTNPLAQKDPDRNTAKDKPRPDHKHRDRREDRHHDDKPPI